jgi:acyl-CoA thioester hydrolase
MRLFDQSVVGDDEIDSLGHMNVRFYMARVVRANKALMASWGVTPELRRGLNAVLNRVDSYCRYHREQFSGAPLQVWGGLLDIGPDAARLLYEVRNPDKGEVAAAFIVVFALEDLVTRARVALPAEVLVRAQAARTELTEHGTPRSIKLDPPRLNVTLEAIEARVGDRPSGMMGAGMERVVEPEDCDDHGFLRPGEDLMFGARLRARLQSGDRPFGPPTFVSDEGHRFAWAWMETRQVQVATPRAGDVLRAVGADVALQRKTRQSRRWIFNTTTGQLAGVDDTVGIALDLDARRSIEIPAKVRAELESRYLPEFA